MVSKKMSGRKDPKVDNVKKYFRLIGMCLLTTENISGNNFENNE